MSLMGISRTPAWDLLGRETELGSVLAPVPVPPVTQGLCRVVVGTVEHGARSEILQSLWDEFTKLCKRKGVSQLLCKPRGTEGVGCVQALDACSCWMRALALSGGDKQPGETRTVT